MSDLRDDSPGMSAGEFAAAFKRFLDQVGRETPAEEPELVRRIAEHLGTDPRGLPILAEELATFEHPNVQRALDAWLAEPTRQAALLGVSGEQKRFAGMGLTDLLAPAHGGLGGDHSPRLGPVDYVNVPIGVGRVLACVQHGLYLLREGSEPLVVLVRGPSEHSGMPKVVVEVMARRTEVTAAFLATLRAGMIEHNVYRGQVLTLGSPHGPWGEGAGAVEFLSLPVIEPGGVVLPAGLLERIERHTVGFSRHAARLLAAGRHLKRGLLLYGPPGTGKTLTLMYLAGRMAGRTTVVLSGRSYGMVAPSCELARTLAPAMVILEDVDLVAEERGMSDIGENPLLFELLNEMDGLAEDADVIFALTTNRPDLLEPALAARPGRVDQATEIPLPDADCRRRLLDLYARGLDLRLTDAAAVVERTEGVSAAFVKELLRRAAVLAAEEGGELVVVDRHVSAALDELLVDGGRLTVRLLGGRVGRHRGPDGRDDPGGDPPPGATPGGPAARPARPIRASAAGRRSPAPLTPLSGRSPAAGLGAAQRVHRRR